MSDPRPWRLARARAILAQAAELEEWLERTEELLELLSDAGRHEEARELRTVAATMRSVRGDIAEELAALFPDGRLEEELEELER